MATVYAFRRSQFAAILFLVTALSTKSATGFQLGDDATCHVQFAALSSHGYHDRTLVSFKDPSETILNGNGLVDKVMLQGAQGEEAGPRILVGTVAISDSSGRWSPDKAEQPDWMRALLARNTAILRRFGHRMVMRMSKELLPLLPWQDAVCKRKDFDQCRKGADRENANWEKEALVAKYLKEPGLTHVVVMDADLVLLKDHEDTLRELAEELDREGKEILFADEDWREKGAGKINGGFIIVKVSNFTQSFFEDLVLSHEEGPNYTIHRCTSNEQLCLSGWLGRPELRGRVLIKSGSMYNCHPKYVQVDGIRSFRDGLRPLNDSSLHILHFMGASKAVAPRVLAALGANMGRHGMQSSNPLAPSVATCNNGSDFAPCFTVDECLAQPAPSEDWRGGGGEKYAFVLSHSLERPLQLPLPNIQSMKYAAERHGMDILLLIPEDGLFKLSDWKRQHLEELGVKIVEVPWTLPPRMRYVPIRSTNGRGWCGRQDFMRLHMFNLTGYSAVAFYDNDIEIQGDVLPALRCAAKGYFLSTSGLFGPMNLGFMAVRPSRGLFEAAVDFAQRATFSPEDGWSGEGFLPMVRHFPGSECGQGFLHTLLYKQTELGTSAFRRAGAGKIVAKQLDRCEWNYQRACPRQGFECSSVRAHHKGGGRDCWKFESDY